MNPGRKDRLEGEMRRNERRIEVCLKEAEVLEERNNKIKEELARG